jgi:hypothetical protein
LEADRTRERTGAPGGRTEKQRKEEREGEKKRKKRKGKRSKDRGRWGLGE